MDIEKMITPRFRAIIDLVPPCKTIADIGTDHAYIPVYLTKKGIAKEAIAMDIKEGPLMRAKSTVLKYNVEDKVKLRLSDGLCELAPGEADVIVIAGMGGLLINEILDLEHKNHPNSLFVLQPMTAEDEVRRYLEKNGFEIQDERLARENEKVYNVISAKVGSMKIENELNYFLGKKLFENKDKNLDYAINKLIKKYEVILDGLKNAKNESEEIGEKEEFAKKMLTLLLDAQKRM